MKLFIISITILFSFAFSARWRPVNTITDDTGSNIAKVTSDGLIGVSNGGAISVSITPVAVTNIVVTSNIFPIGVSNNGTFYSVVTNIVVISNPYPVQIINPANGTNPDNYIRTLLFDGVHSSPMLLEDGHIVTITHLHYKIHEGRLFRATGYKGDVVNNEIINLAVVSSNHNLHVYLEINVSGNSTFSRWRNPVWTNSGRKVDVAQKNSTSTNTSSAMFFFNPVITNYGQNPYDPIFINGGTGAGRTGSSYRTSEEQILASNTIYLISISNFAGTGTWPFSIEATFYEEDD